MEQTLFTAIQIEPSQRMIKIKESLSKMLKNEKVKFYPANKWFLIIRHLGNIDTDFLPDINRILGEIITNTKPFEIKLNGVFIYPFIEKPDVLWFNFEQTPELMILAEKINERLVDYGVHEEFFAFYPHITFARIKNIRNKKLLYEIKDKYSVLENPDTYYIKDIIMFESQKTGKTTAYRTRNRFILGQNL